MEQPSVHVEYASPQWRVRISNEAIPRSHHARRGDALRSAQSLAMQVRADLVVHDIDGTVSERISPNCGVV